MTGRKDQAINARGLGRVDCLFGVENSKQHSNQRSLLVYLSFSKTRALFHADSNSNCEDGPFVTVTNVQFPVAKGASFGFGSAWNRKSDRVAIQDREFSRSDGNVFIIFEADDGIVNIRQIETQVCEETVEIVIERVTKFVQDAVYVTPSDEIVANLSELLDPKNNSIDTSDDGPPEPEG